MRIRSALLALVVVVSFVAVTIPSGAQGVGNNCDVSGTWYGGSDPHYQYQWSMTPVGAGRYYSSIQYGFDIRPLGYVQAAPWAGETVRTGGNTYDVYGISYWLWDAQAALALGLDPSLPEVDIVRSRIRLLDCNTLENTVDVYAAYFDFTPDKTPFVTAADADWLEGAPDHKIVETYYRMPTTLAGFQRAVAGAGVSVAPASKSPERPEAGFVGARKRR
jgi:hypothetical protein